MFFCGRAVLCHRNRFRGSEIYSDTMKEIRNEIDNFHLFSDTQMRVQRVKYIQVYPKNENRKQTNQIL